MLVPIYKRVLHFGKTVPADDLAPNGARPSAGTLPTCPGTYFYFGDFQSSVLIRWLHSKWPTISHEIPELELTLLIRSSDTDTEPRTLYAGPRSLCLNIPAFRPRWWLLYWSQLPDTHCGTTEYNSNLITDTNLKHRESQLSMFCYSENGTYTRPVATSYHTAALRP